MKQPRPSSLSSICLSWLVVVLLSSWAVVLAQVTDCANAESYAKRFLAQRTDTCIADRSTCAATDCSDDCFYTTGLAPSAAITCVDGCEYERDSYKVRQSFLSQYGLVGSVGFPQIFLGYKHEFTAGAEGSFEYWYEANDSTQPANGGGCSFSFNGVACPCVQITCADYLTKSTRMDCSSVEGGAVIDLCKGVSYSDSLTLLETLFVVPFAVCSGTNLDGTPDPAFATSQPGSGSSSSTDTTTQPGNSLTTRSSAPLAERVLLVMLLVAAATLTNAVM